ncbi:Phosphoglucosamine mutase [hydrothermal vent metagenome]|uniref:Phosphoglucosamine mutase n=1 Tax=hydrothermal vent metagenome TaxID=652676 RepID=A0A3B1AWM2_9ZZZZ
MDKKYFGTDGIRGTVGEGVINPAFILKLGWAVGRVLAKGDSGKVLIGKDTRISGYMFESALEAGLAAAGIDSFLLGPMPTPAIAYLTRTFHADAGIVISASHNPYQDNGLKFFSSQGTKLSDEIELAIEAEMEKDMQCVDSAKLGKAERMGDAAGRYIEFCKSTVPSTLNLKGMTIVVDCAHGATYHIGPSVFSELGAEVIAIGVEPDGLNINEKVGSTHPAELQRTVLKHSADLGIALDGDGDRLIMVDHKGEIVDGDELLYIIARSRLSEGCLQGAVVGTLMSNLGLEVALQRDGIDFKRAKVGDRYVMEVLTNGNWSLGGESSGHIICLDRTSTGDGIVAALQVLCAVNHSELSLHKLKSGMRKFPQRMENVRVNGKVDIEGSDSIQQAVRAAEDELGSRGRVLLRPSGTEPLVRVMVEGEDAAQVTRLTQDLAQVVKKAFSG